MIIVVKIKGGGGRIKIVASNRSENQDQDGILRDQYTMQRRPQTSQDRRYIDKRDSRMEDWMQLNADFFEVRVRRNG